MDSLENEAEAAEQAGDLETALSLWRQLCAKERDATLLCRHGRVAQRVGNWSEAENAFNQALGLDSRLALAMECMGILWATRTDQNGPESFELARDWFLRAIVIERQARTFTLLGSVYVALGDLTKARDSFEETIRVNPRFEEALYNLAVLDEKRDPEEAMALFEKAIEIDPDYLLAHQRLGIMYQRDGDLVRADYHFRRSLEVDPTDYWSNVYLGNLLGVQNRDDEAEEMYRRAATLQPQSASSFTFYANFLDAIGKTDEAAKIRASALG